MNEQRVITAQAMGNAVKLDPQFAMPRKPFFARELVTVPLADGLLVDGTGDQQVLRGKATQTLLPRLLPLLDGTRTLDQIVEELPNLPRESVTNAVALLYTRGLLEDSAVDPEEPALKEIDSQILAFFRRHVDVTRVNHSSLEALARLAHARVALYAFGPNADEACALAEKQLRQTGLRHIRTLEQNDDPGAAFESLPGKRLVVVLITGPDDRARLQEIDDACARQHIPWLRASIYPAAQSAELGPYFERGETACYRCYARSAFPLAEEDRAGVADNQHDERLDTRLWTNMLVVETIYLLSRISFLATGLNMTRYNLRTWETQRLRLPKLPGCPLCRPASSVMGMIEPAVLFEDAVAFPSRHLLDPKGHQMHYRASNLELAHEGKRYPGTGHIPLPERSQLWKPWGETLEHLPGHCATSAHPTEPLDLKRLATLLLLSAGIKYTDGNKAHKLQRWCPTGGNLGSVELYAIARNVSGLAPGLYFYQPHEHALAILSSQGQQALIDALLRQALDLDENADLPDALIVLTAAHHRVIHKYGAFAYRIINLDAGVALGQMHLVASYLGLAAHTVPRWADDILADHLDLEDINEAVTAVCALRGNEHCPEEHHS